MNKPYAIRTSLFFIGAVVAFSSCKSVKEYQKSRLNDSEMELSARKSQRFEQSFQSYREGASGANGGKSGGGCGCN
ncbi:DUF4266 domain-containing protein [Chitinophagaceae bacterium LB-8]|uniref:DUF4266 domain-containing protein n=1 Tax=Paraflavisolibacter caeni TaxID=2982496 RepID=A0A9X2XSE2_9BACT|nr:DUF4266 domain-containing protein [Paraflavisolibacter caeni]MCU7548006.1 DUF4266 domain-containing protein [Paraflavisolibacter caeni]